LGIAASRISGENIAAKYGHEKMAAKYGRKSDGRESGSSVWTARSCSSVDIAGLLAHLTSA
jgi:hypothetical protein